MRAWGTIIQGLGDIVRALGFSPGEVESIRASLSGGVI